MNNETETENKKTVEKIKFRLYVKQDDDGNFLRNEALARFTRELDAFIDLQTKTYATIKAALQSLYAQYPGAGLNKDAVITKTLIELEKENSIAIDAMPEVKARIKEIIDGPGGRYYMVGGRNAQLHEMNDKEYAEFKETGKNPYQKIQALKEAIENQKKGIVQSTTPAAAE
jgi:hypothetical protein